MTGSPVSRDISPGCGVRTQGLENVERISGRCPRALSPSASISSGLVHCGTNSRTNAFVSACWEMPGPKTAAVRDSSARNAGTAADSDTDSCWVSGRQRVIASRRTVAAMSPSDFGVAKVTSPTPERSAASVQRCAAPVYPRDPATMSRCPNTPLWPSAGRAGRSGRTESLSIS